MKKHLLLPILAMISSMAFAQPKPLSVYLKGSFSYSSRSSIDRNGSLQNIEGKNITYGFSPGFGFCITEKLIAGIGMRLQGGVSNRSGIENRSTFAYYSTDIFLRYFIGLDKNLRFLFTPELSMEFGDQNSKNFINSEPVSNSQTQFSNIGIRPGFTYYVSPNWGIELTGGYIGYSHSESVNKTNDPIARNISKSFIFNFASTSLQIGVSYVFY